MKPRGKVVPKGKTTSDAKTMNGVKQKPEKKDMHILNNSKAKDKGMPAFIGKKGCK